ncbi:39S ribosomal protein L9, mitochondrial [Sitodiplosis mosellana]|uniref:39S ribosomal protein L9, mitochondrial n=1 Tax=Sitodiplosis mosellana TaxID=263140 RepID=UPI002445300F|nr:39S ribosomal protein L9, mitochondrial [Sitodiplosis mosellana]
MMLRSILQTGRASILQPLINTEIFLAQQTRNTFVFKRRWDPPLAKKGHPARKLKSRHFVYDLIEDGNIIKKPDIGVILTEYVDGLGYQGDLVTVRPNMAYNKLLLTGLAVYDTPENRAKYNTEARLQEERRSPFIERTINVFGHRLVSVCMNKFTPWIIEPWHIRVSMRKAGLYVLDDSQIELPPTPITGPDPAKENKIFSVTVTINKTEKAQVQCRVHHVCVDPRLRDPYVPEWWKQPTEPLFPNEDGQKPADSNNQTKPEHPAMN